MDFKKARYKRRGLGFTPFMANPFTDDTEVDWHHIYKMKSSFVIPMPKLTHRKNLGKKHTEKIKIWINKLYCIDIDKFMDNNVVKL